MYRKYPELTPYQFASNRTIDGIDLEGKEFTFNKWSFDVFFGWAFDFGEGAKQVQRGVAREVAVNSGRMGYQRPEVPQRIQRINAAQDKLKAASDEVLGVAKMEMASADGVSTTMMIGDGTNLVLKSLGKAGEEIVAKIAANELRQQIEKKVGAKVMEDAAEKEGTTDKILNSVLDNIVKQAKSWLGKDYKIITNKAGDNIFMSKSGLRKIRFDIKNSHGDVPHIHLEIFKNGKWRNAIPGTHRIYPKP